MPLAEWSVGTIFPSTQWPGRALRSKAGSAVREPLPAAANWASDSEPLLRGAVGAINDGHGSLLLPSILAP